MLLTKTLQVTLSNPNPPEKGKMIGNRQ